MQIYLRMDRRMGGTQRRILHRGGGKMQILIQHGRVLDPDSGTDRIADVLIEDGKVTAIGEDLKLPTPKKREKSRAAGGEDDVISDESRVIDASGCWVMPGLVDLHVHLRDPGLTYKEDIGTGAEAGARGGFTTICAMPNTRPVIDTPDKLNYVRFKAAALSPIHVMQIGSITKGQKGEELADISGLVDAGAPAISEDGKSVMNANIALEAFRLAAHLGIPVCAHCEDRNLVNGGVVNDDANAVRLGLPGITNSTEDVITARDLVLAAETGAHLHLCHVSTKGAVEMIRMAKAHGVHVTAEVCPHHFSLTSDDIRTDNPQYKMNPPLRTPQDRDALIQGLKDGTIDCIATDHAPHAANEKFGSMLTCAFGIVGLETAVPLTITKLVEPGILSPLDFARVMSTAPAKAFNLTEQYGDGRLAVGNPADIAVIDPGEEWVINKKKFATKGRNTPFDGWKVRGRVKCTIVDGEIVYKDGGYDFVKP